MKKVIAMHKNPKVKAIWRIDNDYCNVYDLYKIRSTFENLERKVLLYMIKLRLKRLFVESFKIVGII